MDSKAHAYPRGALVATQNQRRHAQQSRVSKNEATLHATASMAFAVVDDLCRAEAAHRDERLAWLRRAHAGKIGHRGPGVLVRGARPVGVGLDPRRANLLHRCAVAGDEP